MRLDTVTDLPWMPTPLVNQRRPPTLVESGEGAYIWFRVIPIRFVIEGAPLMTTHSRWSRSRFSAGDGSFEAAYFSESRVTALEEARMVKNVGGVYIELQPDLESRSLRVNVQYLTNVVDLTNRDNLVLLDTTIDELTGEWNEDSPPIPTQQLGAALFARPELTGFVTYSAKDTTRTVRNLVIFPEKVPAGQEPAWTDPYTGIVHLLGRLPT